MSEWPLAVFTLAIQLSCGLALAATLSDWSGGHSDVGMRPLGIAIFPLAAVGMLASLLHLGRPLSAWKSLYNLGTSRLSLEVLLTLLFVLAALMYSHSWWAHRPDHRVATGVATSLLALAAVASSTTVYLIPTQPAWNAGWVPASFFGTALLLGGTASAAFVGLRGPRDLLGCFLAGTVAGGLMLLASTVWMLAALSRVPLDDFAAARMQEALHLLTSQHAVALGLHLLLATVIPIAFAALIWSGRSAPGPPPWLRLLVFLAISLGAFIGRNLMYFVVTLPRQF
ncbi:MAG: reductase anchor subunit [Acidobacteria bacterium]|nr:reductase anchor subunit [Acidobacteriota bacterium]